MKTNIGIDDKNRAAVVEILNETLSDLYLLYTKTRNFHWNVVGPRFNDLHKFFEAQYEALNDSIDEVAERARALGGRSFGSMTEFLKNAKLSEQPGKVLSADKMIATLLSDHESVIRSLREAVDEVGDEHNDQGTTDFLTGLMEGHEKMAWMLRSFLEK